MAELVTEQLDNLIELEKKLDFVAKPKKKGGDGDVEDKPEYYPDEAGELTEIFKTISKILPFLLKEAGGSVQKDLVDAINKVAKTFRNLGDELNPDKLLSQGVSLSGLKEKDIEDAINAIRQALLTVQTLIPSSESIVAPGNEAFNKLDSILKLASKHPNTARLILYKLSQKFKAIAIVIGG